MRFYRGFIQRLASHFKGVPEIFQITRKFGLDALSADTPIPTDVDLKRLILRSCHTTLIHLGDLSRYRETELNQKARNWGPAKGYYDLATALNPADGQAFNQLAVISLADNDHLRAVYFLYRALSTQNALPHSLNNLDIEFKKILRHHQRGKALPPADSPGISTVLVTAFLAYHAACNTNPDFSDHESQRKEMLAHLATELKTKPFDSAFRRMCLINIAASSRAQEQIRRSDSEEDAKLHKLRPTLLKTQILNIETFAMFLDLLSEELHVLTRQSAELSPCTRRLLPLLRLYDGWLLSDISFLLENQLASDSIPEIKNFWTAYARALTLLVAAFSIQTLPRATYLLYEDQDTAAFTPFSSLVREFHFEGADGSMKPSRDDAVVLETLSLEQEMLFRIRDFVIVGLHLSKHKVSEPPSWLFRY